MKPFSNNRLPNLLIAIFVLSLALGAGFGQDTAQDATTATGKTAPAKADGETATTHTAETAPAKKADGNDKYTVFKIELHEAMMGEGVPFFIHRSIEAAKAAEVDAIVLDLNTPGGSLGVLMQISNELVDLEIPLYAYVNNMAASAGSLLAVSADTIVMSPVSYIGGAQVITSTGAEISEVVEQKINSTLKAMVRANAKTKGHPVVICEAFIDRKIEIPGLTPDWEVLTLDQEQATTQTVYVDAKTSETVVIPPLAAFIAKDVEDLLKKDNLWPAEVTTYTMVWSEHLAKWLMSIRPFLLIIGLIALFLEAKTPGIGAPAAVGVIALALFFWSHHLADLANAIEIVLFLVGIGLILVEIFVLPGFGLAGVTGVLLLVTCLVMAMMKMNPPDMPEIGRINYDMLTGALRSLSLTFIGLIPLVWLIAKFLPGMPLFQRILLDPAVAAADDIATAAQSRGLSLAPPPAHEDLLGATGKALTDLRPAGTALVQGRHLDVTTIGEYIEKGDLVHIVEIHGNVYTVEKVTQSSE